VADVSNDAKAKPPRGPAGFRFFTDPGAVFTIAGGTGIVPDYGSPTYRVIFGFAWHDRNYDADNDGDARRQDKCPDDPEDRDGFEDTDGCPDVDNDKDGVNDAVQSASRRRRRHSRVRGRPRPLPARARRQGRLPGRRRLPRGRQRSGQDPRRRRQVPQRARDAEQLPGHGRLPGHHPRHRQGRPARPEDKCPTDPEDKDGFEDTDGCPDPDNDKDGILDVHDRAPTSPRWSTASTTPTAAPIRASSSSPTAKIEILEKVYFDFNKATIKPQSASSC
jgi:OOP family OmpA-OmpF porin